MKKIYDYIVIGAGISACTFASVLNKRFSDNSILLVENGRRLGGRSTTRRSRKNIILEFDHGLPSISFSHNISQDLFSLISPLIKSKKLIDIRRDILHMNDFGDLDCECKTDRIYRSVPFMVNFCEEIINQSINPKQINFAFNTLTKSIQRTNDFWEVEINKHLIKCRNLILSSSLLVHPRCLEILNINTLPLRDSITKGKDDLIDSVLRETAKQKYIKRKNYIFYVSNFQIVSNFNYKYLQILFSKVLINNCNFERLIFQRQLDGSMIIVLHCAYFNKEFDISIDQIIYSLKRIFVKHQNFLDLFSHLILIDIMNWRASQPYGNLLSKELQWSSKSNIGFCGDWFDIDGLKGVEAAMNSSIRLTKLLS